MAFVGAHRVAFFVILFFFITPAYCQFPITNGTWRDLLDSVEIQRALSGIAVANGTLKDVLNSPGARKALAGIYRTLQQQLNWDSILKRMSAPQMKLGACADAIASLRNDSGEMFKYLDAAGKPQSGLLQGSFAWMGSVDGCQDIPDSHFCVSAFGLSLPSFNITIPFIAWSGCFPKSCNEKNVSAVLADIDSKVPKFTRKTVYLKNYGAKCSEKAPYTSGAIASIVVCGILLLLCLIGTIIDMVIEQYESPAIPLPPVSSKDQVELTPTAPCGLSKNHNTESSTALTLDIVISHPPKKPSILDSFCCEFFLCFSLVRNSKKIFNTNVPPIAITSINGIRVISISWVILGHALMFFAYSPFVENKARIRKDAKLLSVMPVINGFYSVDSFFFLSGLLVAYTCFRKMAKSDGKFNWILFYVHRFWRLTPSYMFVILFMVHLNGLLSDAPMWYENYQNPLCLKYWWTNLLYINNFHPKEFADECMGWSWYLANDMQFFVITPLLLIVAYKYAWRGVAATAGSLLMISSVVIATLYGYFDLDPVQNMKFNHPRTDEFVKKENKYYNYIYSKPYCRIQPYLVGFILGYFMYKKCGDAKRPGWIVAIVGWSVAAVVGMSLVYAPHEGILPEAREWSKAENIIYGTFQRLLWGLALAWVTYACHYGYGGIIQKFLSSKFWMPLSRLTYSVYLVHMPVLRFMVMAAEGAMYYSISVVSYYFLAALLLSYGAGFILAVAIEFPCGNLENLVLKSLRKRQTYRITH